MKEPFDDYDFMAEWPNVRNFVFPLCFSLAFVLAIGLTFEFIALVVWLLRGCEGGWPL